MDLKTARLNKSMTQAKAAYLVGVTERAWRRWENGEKYIPSQHLPKIQKVLGLTDKEVMSIIRNFQKESN